MLSTSTEWGTVRDLTWKRSQELGKGSCRLGWGGGAGQRSGQVATVGVWEGAGGLERLVAGRSVGFRGCGPSLGKFLAGRQVTRSSPHLPPSHLPQPSGSFHSCRERLSEGTAAYPVAL